MFTVKRLSKMAGVTPRTLHHYDDIGLLKPSHVGNNSYRYYGEESLLRLQQILFHREMDMPLENIRKIMGCHDFDALKALERHPRC
ncbi:MAG TPA: MerR family transcriptional regulator [Anaerolineales bacterium]|nr:MerR family transcriptional regulator [Anaerolineales bacterium]